MFLQDIAAHLTIRDVDGGSLKVAAASLSHLLRFAYKCNRNVWELNDGHMKQAVHALQEEADPLIPYRERRSPNTVDRIVSTWIEFMRWLQANVITDRIIAGPIEQKPQIPLVERTFPDSRGIRRTVLKYRYTQAPSTPDPKGPMPRDLRIKLWDEVQRRSDPDTASPRYRMRFESESEFRFELNYLKKRRELLLELLENLGRRPKELSLVLASDNDACTKEGRFRVKTVKRRRKRDPIGDVPVPFQTAVHVELFITKYRKELLDRLRARGLDPRPEDKLFLSVDGHAMTEQTMEKEFRRIVKASGAMDERACMSMFRHRFITNMVKAHLKSFMDEHPSKGRQLMTESDYRTILKRVAAFTGHADENSLMSYIDLAWNELGVFDAADNALALVTAVESGINSITSLIGDASSIRHLSGAQIAEKTIEELRQMRQHVLDIISKRAQISHES